MTDTKSPEYKSEVRKVVRCFFRYDHDTRAMHASSHRLGHRQREAVGEFIYTHPDLPGVCWPTRKLAAEAALRLREQERAQYWASIQEEDVIQPQPVYVVRQD